MPGRRPKGLANRGMEQTVAVAQDAGALCLSPGRAGAEGLSSERSRLSLNALPFGLRAPAWAPNSAPTKGVSSPGVRFSPRGRMPSVHASGLSLYLTPPNPSCSLPADSGRSAAW